MNVFEKRISLEDIKPGVVAYPVISPTGSVAVVYTPVEFASKPYTCPTLKCTVKFDMVGVSGISNYVRDNNVKGLNYTQHNFSALFLNKEDAEAYASMINNNELPDDLRVLRDKFVAKNQEYRDIHDDWW